MLTQDRTKLERILKQLQSLEDTSDTERAHGDADVFLLEVLTIVNGYRPPEDRALVEEIIEAYRATPKWFA